MFIERNVVDTNHTRWIPAAVRMPTPVGLHRLEQLEKECARPFL